MLEVCDLEKSYRRHQVLKKISFSVRPGACVGIVGENGCGKTTLLSILAGARKPDRGKILFDGQDAAGNPKIFSRAAAYVPQENPLIEELTVRDNLKLWYRGSKKELERDLISGSAAMLGVDQMLKKEVCTLSGGMKKRLSIACALSNHASVLILDEPGAALDLECKAVIRDYLEQYRRLGGTILLTSHEMAELSLCTELYVLRDGHMESVPGGLSEMELIKCFKNGTFADTQELKQREVP